jgi:putative spermidine/putrescine transport system permease protein
MTRRRRPLGRLLLSGYLLLFLLYAESPLVIIGLTSFHNVLTVAFPPTRFSTQWYGVLRQELNGAPGMKPGLLDAIWGSLWLGLAAMAGAAISRVLAACGLQRFGFPERELLRQCFLLPLLFPQVVTGIGLVIWFSRVGEVPTWMRLILAHLILTLPYVIVTVTASLETLDQRVEEAAMNLGAGGVARFVYVTLQGIRGGIISGAIFAWLISFSNFTVTFFLCSSELTPSPARLYEFIQYFVDPSIAALSTLLVILAVVVLLIVDRMFALGRLVGLRR